MQPYGSAMALPCATTTTGVQMQVLLSEEPGVGSAGACRPIVFIVDDDAQVCRSLARLVRSAGFDVESFTSARQFIERAPWAETGCVVLDVQMDGISGPQLHELMSGKGICLPVVFLTGHGDVPTGVRAIKNGAVDFLLKPVDEETLLRAIGQAIAGQAAENAHQRERHEFEARLGRKTAREREVLEFVIGGHLNKQIAVELGISEKTVKAHRGRVMEKMAVDSVAELVRLCDRAGLRSR